MIKSKIKMADLRDRLTLQPVNAYNDTANGVPMHAYSTPGTDIYCSVMRSTKSVQDDDKTKSVQDMKFVVRLDDIIYTIEDRIVYAGQNYFIKDIIDIDLWYRSLICYKES
jgi:hypothetical protein